MMSTLDVAKSRIRMLSSKGSRDPSPQSALEQGTKGWNHAHLNSMHRPALIVTVATTLQQCASQARALPDLIVYVKLAFHLDSTSSTSGHWDCSAHACYQLPGMTSAGKPPDLTVDDKTKASFVTWFKKLEGQTAQVYLPVVHMRITCTSCTAATARNVR